MTRIVDFRPALRPVALAVTSLVLAACGGGGGGGGSSLPGVVTPSSISGTAVDGYIRGATIECLSGSTLVATTISDKAGKFSFALPAGQSCDRLEAHGGVDVGVTPDDPSDDVVRPAGVMRTPVPTGSSSLASLIVSPLSTLVHALVDAGQTPAAAEAQVKASLGLAGGLDLLATDPAGEIALYRAGNVIAHLSAQITAAIAAAAGITDLAQQHAISSSVIASIAAALPSLGSLDALAPTPGSLTPASPLVSLIEQAAAAAMNSSDGNVASALAGLQPQTLALIAAPLVAAATNPIVQAPGIQHIVNHAGTVAERDQVSTVVGGLSGLLGKLASDGEQQAVLDAIAAALSESATEVTVAIGGESASAPVPNGPSNFLRLARDQLVLHDTAGNQTVATLTEFESSAGVTVPRSLAKIGFTLQQSNDGMVSAAPREVPLAIEATDTSRVLQAIIDRVSFTPVDGNIFSASIPAGAKLYIYGKSADKETTTPVEIALDGAGLGIVSTDSSGQVTLDVERVLNANPAALAPGSALADLSIGGLSGGKFSVTAVVGGLRIARGADSRLKEPESLRLATPHTITLGAGSQSVSGYGVKGTVLVGN